MRSLGCHVDGAILPMPDIHHAKTTVAGVMKRFAIDTPQMDGRMLRRFRQFVRVWLSKNMKPLTQLDGFEEWLGKTHYPAWRKEELRSVWEACNGVITKKHYKCKSFVKSETYTEFKHARCINSRTDAFKCFTGPFFRQIEEELFHGATSKFFVKGVPIPDRPAYLYERLFRMGGTYVATDHTAFEAHMTIPIMRACELQLYKYMASHLPQRSQLIPHIERALAGINHCRFRNVSVDVPGCRMSGDMCTSLGNGFTNLMVMLFLCSELGTSCDGVCEGDDGLFVVSGTIPSTELFSKLGFRVKMEVKKRISEAGFCSMFFDETVRSNVADPIELLAKFGWTLSKLRHSGPGVMLSLLRAKGFSLAYELGSCPVAAALARYAIRVTKGSVGRVDDSSENIYKRSCGMLWNGEMNDESANSAIGKCVVPEENRELVERLFGLCRADQLQIESYLDSLNSVQPLSHWSIVNQMRRSWCMYHTLYSKTFCPGEVEQW